MAPVRAALSALSPSPASRREPASPAQQRTEHERSSTILPPAPPSPASATSGFIQPHPQVRSAFRSDLSVHRVISLFLPPPGPDPGSDSPSSTSAPAEAFLSKLSRISALALSPSVLRHLTAAEHSPPFLLGAGRTALGAPQPSASALVTSHGWRALQDVTIGHVQLVHAGWPQITDALPADPSLDARQAIAQALRAASGVSPAGPVGPATQQRPQRRDPSTAAPNTLHHPGATNDNHLARVRQMLLLHSWTASSAYTVCPSAMQDGAVAVLGAELLRLSSAPVSAWLSTDFLASQSRAVFARALQRLLSTDTALAWTSGQWMTERPGGSDVGRTETVARWAGPCDLRAETDADGNPLGPWTVDGFKWFSSAADGGCAIILARTERGISCFFAPTRRMVWRAGSEIGESEWEEEYNGISPQRLKTKLGTKALPTAELELRGMRAWLVGVEGQGVRVISAMLNVTRVYNASTAVAYLGRGLGVVRAYSRVRRLPSRGNVSLQSVPLYARTVAKVAIAYRADMLLTFFVAALLGRAENPVSAAQHGHAAASAFEDILPQEAEDVAMMLRVLTPVAKARTAKTSIAGLQECMECLGGLGYLENDDSPELNVARLYRDANVLSIWEGTTDVMATDTVKVLKGKNSAGVKRALWSWLTELGISSDAPAGSLLGHESAVVHNAWVEFLGFVEGADGDILPAMGREILQMLGDLVCAVLLLIDAKKDEDELVLEISQRFVREKFGVRDERNWSREGVWDVRIAFEEPTTDEKPKSRL